MATFSLRDSRFTELVRQDHDNAQAENLAKGEMDKGEEGVEKGFSGTSASSESKTR